MEPPTVILERLSIPLWCDWDPGCHSWAVAASSLSIPLWCDWDQVVPALQKQNIPAFNPTVVRLGHSAPCRLSGVLSTFNPTVVRLGLVAALEVATLDEPFNPTVVRLGLGR